MKNKKLGLMTATALIGSVILISGISYVRPLVHEVSAGQETITANLNLPIPYAENFINNSKALGETYTSTAYRYYCSNGLILYHKEYSGSIAITEVEPLPGMFSNNEPIQGITKIVATYSGEGLMRYDTYRDFRYEQTELMSGTSFTKTFTSNYPCYFRIETNGQNLILESLTIWHDNTLGDVNEEYNPSGFNHHRLKTPTGGTSMPIDVTFNEDFSDYTVNRSGTYDDTTLYTDLTSCVNQLLLFKKSTLNINKPSGYSNPGGYVTAFNGHWNSQTYYEYDVPLDNSSGRGVGRLIIFPKGVDSLGYGDSQPLIVFTDDHYLTFQEYLNYGINNKAVFSPRFKAESVLPGYTWTPSATVGVPGSGTAEGPTPIKPPTLVSKINLSPTFRAILIYESYQLTAEVLPENATNKKLSYSSSDTSICKVSNSGIITGISIGTAMITASSTDGSDIISNQCKINVLEEPNDSLEFIKIIEPHPKTVPYKSEYNSIDVLATYNNNTTKIVSASLSMMGGNKNITDSIGGRPIFASYTEDGVTKTAITSVFVTNVGATRTEHVSTGESIKTTTKAKTNTFLTDDNGNITSDKITSDNADNQITWTLQCDTTPSNLNFEGNHKASQIGKGKVSPNIINIYTDDLINEIITKVVVKASKRGGATLSVKVGDVQFGNQVSLPTDSDSPLEEYTFEGNASGRITITYSGGKGNAYFGSVEVFKAGGIVYSWTGDDQASSFIAYLKGFNSCSTSWGTRSQIPTLINEYNAMIDDAKRSELMTQMFEDNGGYMTTPIEKLQMIVNQYNSSLSAGETALSLTGVPKGQSEIQSIKSKIWNGSSFVVITLCLFVLNASVVIIYKTKKKRVE